MSAIKQISATVGGQAGIQVETEENRMEQSVEKISGFEPPSVCAGGFIT